MKKILFLFVFLTLGGCDYAYGQSVCPEMPTGTLCISQAAGNAAAQNARELAATKDKVAVLEAALADKDKSIAELKAAGERNVVDLTAALHKTEIELATKSGQLIGAEASVTRCTAITDLLLKSVRPKKFGIINF
jgi:outer membrane lipopolysaccharide assembly protein LptE/RlpB